MLSERLQVLIGVEQRARPVHEADRRGPIATADRACATIEGLTVLDPSVDGWLSGPDGTMWS